MNREAVKALLDDAGVSTDAYHLWERPLDGFYAVPLTHGWAVYYQERGGRFDEKTFASESAACTYLIELLSGWRNPAR